MDQNSRAKAVLMILRDIAAIEDTLHREHEFDAVENELIQLRGGCRCERTVKGKTNRMVDVRLFHGIRDDFAQVSVRQDDIADRAGHGNTIGDAYRKLDDD